MIVVNGTEVDVGAAVPTVGNQVGLCTVVVRFMLAVLKLLLESVVF